MRLVAAVAIVICSLSAFAGTIDPRTPDSKHVQYGEKFKCVARITCRRTSDGGMQSASCVVIDDRWIMTAAHVVAGTDSWIVELDDKSQHSLSGVILHPEFDDAKFCTADVALGKVTEKFSLDYYPPLYARDSEVGSVVSICGYGMGGTFSTGSVSEESTYKKRGGSNVVFTATARTLFCSVTDLPRTELEYLISPGDSGGGMFSGSGELMGINSFVMASGPKKPRSAYGDESAHVRVSAIREWAVREMRCDDE